MKILKVKLYYFFLNFNTLYKLDLLYYYNVFNCFIFLAPSKIGDSCQRDCKPPLLCRDGKCECWGGSVVDGKCTVRKQFYT